MKPNTGGCEVGRTHFCSFSISHKPTQSSPRHQMSGTLPSFLISHHDSANTSSQQTRSNAENNGPAFFLPPPLVFYSFFCPSTDVHVARVWGSHSISCNRGHFTVHEHSRLARGRSNMVVRTRSCGQRKVFSSLALLLNALKQLQVQLQF